MSENMSAICEMYKKPENRISEEETLYQRNSYHGWEISATKDFKESVCCHSFEQMYKGGGFAIVIGKENPEGLWQEKLAKELLGSDGWDKNKAIKETVSVMLNGNALLSQKKNIQQIFNENGIRIVNIDSGNDITGDLFASDSISNRTEHQEIAIGNKIGVSTVTDVYRISDGVYQTTLEQTKENGVSVSGSYFVLDSDIAKNLSEELKPLVVLHGEYCVIENKNNEPYILKELIDKKLMPPRDNSFVQQLTEYIAAHPVKYASLYPVSTENFENNLRMLSEIDKDLHKTPLELGQKLLSMFHQDNKEEHKKSEMNNWLKSKGCDSKENMEKVFSSWLHPKNPNVEKKQKKDGYPPRGDS